MKHNLYHHGILGQKWGVRRFQNKDGKLTSAGKKRYRKKEVISNAKKVLAVGAAAAGAALAVCGTYKLAKSGKLDGLIQTGKHTVQNFNYVNSESNGRAIRGKLSGADRAKFFGDEYKRRNNAMDVHIRNRGRL